MKTLDRRAFLGTLATLGAAFAVLRFAGPGPFRGADPLAPGEGRRAGRMGRMARPGRAPRLAPPEGSVKRHG